MDPTGRRKINPWLPKQPGSHTPKTPLCAAGFPWPSEAPFLQDAFQIDPIEEHVLEVDVDDLMAVGAGAGAGESFLDPKKCSAMQCQDTTLLRPKSLSCESRESVFSPGADSILSHAFTGFTAKKMEWRADLPFPKP